MSAEEMELGTGSEEMDDGELMDEDFGESDYDFPLNKEKNVTEDGGVTKTVLSEGSGYERPEKGDQVEVHYVGTLLDGTQFDSSRDRGTPFSFGLGKGEVIKGWDEGVKTMLKGEKAILQCKPEYAYGASGSPPTIPPDSTLKFEVELLSWKSVKDISGDGGVIKKTVKEGTGWENPKDKDEVCVKYEVRLDGSSEVVASSGETGEEFVLHEGHFCKALPIAVKKMKEGEQAMLTVQPDYGFGSEGQPPQIPPNATLTINLELVSWKTVENVTDDGAVVKKILKKGEGYDKPREGAKASLRYTGRLLDGTIFEERAEGNEHEIVVDEEQVIDGLDLAIMKMVKKEVAEITVQSSYGFGDEETQKEKATVPAGSTVKYTVELVDLENPKNTWDMSNEEKVEDSRLKKEKGNEAYKQGKLQKAVKRYDAAIKSIEYDKDFGEAKNAAKDLKKAIWLNLAAANLKLDEFSKAIENCGKVLEIDTSNVKALYRRSQAYMGRGDYIEAELDIKKARSNDPNNKDILVFMRKMKEKIKAASKQEAKLYSTMFSKMAKLKDQEQDEGKSVNVENSGSDGKDAGPSGEPVQEAAAGPSS